MKFFIILKIIITKIIRLNLAFIKRQVSGYPKFVEKFENNFAKYIGKKYGISFCNGTSSIEAAIYALNFSKDDEILVPSSTFHASIGPIKNLNCKPIFVDVNSSSLTIDCEDLQSKITERTKGILIVHTWGFPCNMDLILDIVKKNNLKLVEDCSHAHGALYDGKKIGSFGDISCFSLQGNKSVAAGEGGISLTNDKELFLKMSTYGHFNRHENDLNEYNNLRSFSKTGISKKLRAHPLGICLASVDLEYLDILNKYRNEICSKIDNIFIKYNSINVIKIHEKAKRAGFFGGHPFVIDKEDKIKEIKENFRKFNIDLLPYPWPLHHKMKIFNTNENKLKNTEELKNKLFSIGMPFFLNFDFQNLEKCLLSCKALDLID